MTMIDADVLIQALSDWTRLRAVVLLGREGTLCVCEVTAALDVSQPKMSRHLAALRALAIVDDCRVANRVFYRLNPNLPDWARGVIDHLGESLTASAAFKEIGERLRGMPNRPPERADFQGADDDAASERIERETANAA